jgi:hypothetical protein
MDMSRMREVATDLQAQDEYVHMSALGEAGVRLLAELQDFRLEKVSLEATRAVAETREVWDYTHVSVKSGIVLRRETGVVYLLAWDLVPAANGNWLVSDARVIDVTRTPEGTGSIDTAFPSGLVRP